jgi:hypothetical protein
MLRKIFWIGILGALITLIATPAFARTAELKDAGVTLWVFLVIGATIILLQLIPAGILFFSFVSTTTATVYTKPRKVEKTGDSLVTQPATVKR